MHNLNDIVMLNEYTTMHDTQIMIIYRRKKAASESSMGETEDEHNEKFSNLKRDVADSGKKKSVGFTVGQGEVQHI